MAGIALLALAATALSGSLRAARMPRTARAASVQLCDAQPIVSAASALLKEASAAMASAEARVDELFVQARATRSCAIGVCSELERHVVLW